MKSMFILAALGPLGLMVLVAACQKDEAKPPLSSDEPPVLTVGGSGGTPDGSTGDAAFGNVLATAASEVRGVAVAGTDVYFVFAGQDDADAGGTGGPIGVLARVPRAGGATTEVVRGGTNPRALSVAGVNMFWMDDTGSTSTLVRLTSTTVTTAATLALGSVYVATTTALVAASPGVGAVSVDRIPDTEAGTVQNLGSLLGDNGPVRIAVDQGTLYLLVAQSPGGGLFRLPLGGGVPENIWSAPGGIPRDLAVTAGRAFVALDNGTDGQIVSIPLPGGAPQALVSPVERPAQIALSSDQLYFTTATGQLVRAPLGGGATTVLATDIGTPGALALGDDAAYIASGRNVLRLPR